ncbi:MAG: hypothetical protein ACRYHA_03740 [Janthinobacterium lividum]
MIAARDTNITVKKIPCAGARAVKVSDFVEDCGFGATAETDVKEMKGKAGRKYRKIVLPVRWMDMLRRSTISSQSLGSVAQDSF